MDAAGGPPPSPPATLVPTPAQRSELRSVRNKVMTSLSRNKGSDLLVLRLFDEEEDPAVQALWGRRTAYTWSAALQACASSPNERWGDALRLLDRMGGGGVDDGDGVESVEPGVGSGSRTTEAAEAPTSQSEAPFSAPATATRGSATYDSPPQLALFGPVHVRANEYHVGIAMKCLLSAGRTEETIQLLDETLHRTG